jgi:hypothetical protein
VWARQIHKELQQGLLLRFDSIPAAVAVRHSCCLSVLLLLLLCCILLVSRLLGMLLLVLLYGC